MEKEQMSSIKQKEQMSSIKRNKTNFNRSIRSIQTQLSIASSIGDKCDSINASKYQDWFDILVKDDHVSAEMLLSTVTKDESDMLLGCTFDFEDSQGFGKQEEIMEEVNLPLHVAVGCSSRDVAEVMLRYGVNVLATNDKGNNVLHSAVITAFNRPAIEQDICDTLKWLVKQLTEEKITTLLFQENKDGLRPVEFAAQQGALKIMMAYFYMPGHVTSQRILGLGDYRMHEITEYEIGDRHKVSPLNMLAFLDAKKLEDPVTAEIILGPFISGWIDKKIRCNMPLIFLWAMIRLLFIGMFIILDVDVGWLRAIHKNNSDTVICPELAYVNMGIPGNLTFSILLVLYCSIMIVTYVVEYFVKRKQFRRTRLYNLTGKKNVVTNLAFYTAIQPLLVIVILFACIQSLDLIVTNFRLNFVTFLLTDLARSFIPVLCLWSICFFLQLSQTIGSSIISIQGMLIDLARFMLLFVIIVVPFVHVFEQFSLANSNTGCVPQFSSPYMTSYTLFRVMLNIFDPSQLDMQNIAVLYILHILFVFMVGILLINFLIAMMSKKATEVADHEKVVIKINQLALVTVLEDRMFMVERFGKWLYRKLTKSYFCCEDGKVFLKSVGCRFTQMYQEKTRTRQNATYVSNSTHL